MTIRARHEPRDPGRSPGRLARTLVLAAALTPGSCGPAVRNLEPGDTLVYRTTWTLPDGSSGTGVSTDRVVGTTEIGGVRYLRDEWFTAGRQDSKPLVTFVRATSEGLVERATGDDGEEILFPAKPAVGRTWTRSPPGGSLEYEITGLDVAARTPSGEFRCVATRMRGGFRFGTVVGEVLRDLRIGVVRQVETYGDGTRLEYDLVGYAIRGFGRSEAPMEADVLAATDAWNRAWLDHDADRVDALMGPDYVYIAPDREVLDRDAVLDIVRSPSYRLDSGTRTDAVVATLGDDEAAVAHRFRGSGSFDGKPFTDDHRCVSVFERANGAWRAAWEHCRENLP